MRQLRWLLKDKQLICKNTEFTAREWALGAGRSEARGHTRGSADSRRRSAGRAQLWGHQGLGRRTARGLHNTRGKADSIQRAAGLFSGTTAICINSRSPSVKRPVIVTATNLGFKCIKYFKISVHLAQVVRNSFTQPCDGTQERIREPEAGKP